MREEPKVFGSTARPPGLGRNATATIVKGHTMGGILHNSLIYYDRDKKPPSVEIMGEIAIVALKDTSEEFVRIIEQGSRPNLYNLRSFTGPMMTDVEVLWAAPIRWIRLPTAKGVPGKFD